MPFHAEEFHNKDGHDFAFEGIQVKKYFVRICEQKEIAHKKYLDHNLFRFMNAFHSILKLLTDNLQTAFFFIYLLPAKTSFSQLIVTDGLALPLTCSFSLALFLKEVYNMSPSFFPTFLNSI